MTPSPWPPTGALWTVVAVGLAGVIAGAVTATRTEWLALPLAVALWAAAVAVDRHVGRRRRTGAVDERRLASDEASQVREVVERRPVLLRGILAVAALLGAGTVGWLWRYAPRRDGATGWADGVRAVDATGEPVRGGDLPPGGIVTVWPEGHRDRELAAVVVLRLAVPAGGAAVDGDVLAYSRICTHAGCPVALFRAEDATLYCPCHQATFDARRGAEPVFGPAPRPLPSLPLGTDAEGFLVARGDLSAWPGPEVGGRS